MESDSVVTVSEVTVAEWDEESNFYYAFEPNHEVPTVGFIIYPGAWLDPRAYAPSAHSIAAEGYLVVIVKMPGDVAVLGAERANEVIENHPEIERWVLGGHSLGGSFACAYAEEFTDKIEGVVLWASYPSENFRIDATDLKAISIYGSNDGHPEKIEAGAEHLPADTEFVRIEGGNHTQFGWYDTSPKPAQYGASPNPVQVGDNPANITRANQQNQIIGATIAFLEQFDMSPPASAIPTLSEWGIIILMTIFLVISVVMLYKRKEI
jgi:pimeloyl-ACP methyl ester carboxylesterase